MNFLFRLIPKSANSFFETRLSSQAIIFASRKISKARGDMSCKLPIGVEIIYKPFFNIFFLTLQKDDLVLLMLYCLIF